VSSLMLALIIMLVPVYSSATIIGSAHDLSSISGGMISSINEDEICVFCHTPHGAVPPDRLGYRPPLWNRSLNENAVFNMYSSLTFDGSYDNNKPTGQSLMCLGCHDGVSTFSAIINYSPDPILMSGINAFGEFPYPPSHDVNIGSDLRNDHPVSFVYDGNLVALDTARRGTAGLNTPVITGIGALKLYNWRMECTTCHDPHENDIADRKPFLRMSNTGSTMCTTCHIM
ncbi:MAG TPA: cytochrome c3 family protein, partial [Nitrospirota bacterium]|nr:cytochrome c3 family protein [Nitrospirota bacterium]